MTSSQEADALAAAAEDGDRFDRVIRLAQAIFGAPIAALNLVGEEEQHTVAAIGAPTGDIPVGQSICQYTVQQPAIFEVPDLRADPRFAENPIVAGAPRLRFYAGVPLSAPSGHRVGALCILDLVPRELGPVEHEMLADLGAVLERELAIEAEMQRAGDVQRRLLPAEPPDVPGLEMAGLVRQAREAGGDFYDWQVIPANPRGRRQDDPPVADSHALVQVTLADVMGKGLPASLLASEMRAVLRTHSRYVPLDVAVARTSETTEASLTSNGAFVTLWTGRIDPVDGSLSYVDAGHGLAAIVSERGVRRLAQGHMPLGLPVLEEWRLGMDVIAPDETLVIVSDGVFDVFDDSLEDAMAALQRTTDRSVAAGESAESMARTILDYAGTHGAADDLTAVVVRRTGTTR